MSGVEGRLEVENRNSQRELDYVGRSLQGTVTTCLCI